jgi:protein gp37
MNIDPTDPAYPQTEEFNNLRPGFTKREELIKAAMQGLATAPGWISDPDEAAQWAIQRARRRTGGDQQGEGMSEQTKIEWATSSWNPWLGCTKVSPGCANCYAEISTPVRAARGQGNELWGKGNPRRRTSASYWNDPLKWNRQCEPDRVSGEASEVALFPESRNRPRIFPSLCDWLDDEVPIEWLADFLRLIHDTPHLDWLLLTKRPENFERRLGSIKMGDADVESGFAAWCLEWALVGGELVGGPHDGYEPQPPPNVWLGISVEDQKRADERIPALLKIPARVRFLSVEPMLGPVQLKGFRTQAGTPPLLHWVIVGGESGPKARMCNPEWIRSVLKQCQAAGVACFVKQLGATTGQTWSVSPGMGHPLPIRHPKGGDPSEWPEDLRVREFPLITTNPKSEGSSI